MTALEPLNDKLEHNKQLPYDEPVDQPRKPRLATAELPRNNDLLSRDARCMAANEPLAALDASTAIKPLKPRAICSARRSHGNSDPSAMTN